MKLFLPNRFIGLVIGRNGNIVREIQTTHKVYVETPKYDVRQFFRVYGIRTDIIAAVEAIQRMLHAKTMIELSIFYRNQDEVHLLE